MTEKLGLSAAGLSAAVTNRRKELELTAQHVGMPTGYDLDQDDFDESMEVEEIEDNPPNLRTSSLTASSLASRGNTSPSRGHNRVPSMMPYVKRSAGTEVTGSENLATANSSASSPPVSTQNAKPAKTRRKSIMAMLSPKSLKQDKKENSPPKPKALAESQIEGGRTNTSPLMGAQSRENSVSYSGQQNTEHYDVFNDTDSNGSSTSASNAPNNLTRSRPNSRSNSRRSSLSNHRIYIYIYTH